MCHNIGLFHLLVIITSVQMEFVLELKSTLFGHWYTCSYWLKVPFIFGVTVLNIVVSFYHPLSYVYNTICVGASN